MVRGRHQAHGLAAAVPAGSSPERCYRGKRTAQRYEVAWPHLFEPAVVGPVASLLADPALVPRAIEGYPVDIHGNKADLTMAYVGYPQALRGCRLYQGSGRTILRYRCRCGRRAYRLS